MNKNNMSLIKNIFITIILITGCTNQKSLFNDDLKTCVVLSVGGLKGLAHIGAIDAIVEKGIEIDCVFGNSAGSIIGGIYTFSPEKDLKSNVKTIINLYHAETKKTYESKSALGFLFGAGLAFISGGTLGWGTMLGSAVLNTMSIDKIDNQRVETVLDKYFSSKSFDDLVIPFATSYYTTESSIKLNTISTGNLAKAISRSANNPLIFKKTSLDFIDPGLDRFSSVPIEDAIKHFNPDVIIAVNVTGNPAKYNKSTKCEIIEIIIDVDDIDFKEIKNIDEILDTYYQIGYNTVISALDSV